MPEGGRIAPGGHPSVMFVSSYGGSGGSEIYLERLLRLIPSSLVGAVISLADGSLSDRIRAAGHRIDVLETSGDLRSMASSSLALRRRIRRLRPDVVHANGLKAAIVSVLASIGTHVPVVWVRHDFSWEGWRARALASRCWRVVCVSHALTTTFSRRTFNKIEVVHTGIPEIRLDRAQARRNAGGVIADEQASPLVSLVASLVPGKGHLELIEIAPDLLQALPTARVLFVGDAPSQRFHHYLERLHRRVDELDVGHSVTFLGHRDDALTWIAASDVVVMPSMSLYREIETEGFPMLALEALVVGTPVAGYAVGGLPELLGDCGILVTPGDRRALLKAILTIVKDRATWARLSRCGRTRAQRSFDAHDMVRKLTDIYRSATR